MVINYFRGRDKMNIKSMKYLLIILFCFESINSYTQKSNTIYNTTVDKATKVEVKGGVTNIKKLTRF